MLDIKRLRKEGKDIQKKLQTKEPSVDLEPILRLDHEIRECKTAVEALKAKRNEASQKIGEMKRRGENTEPLMKEIALHGDEIQALDQKLVKLEDQFLSLMAHLPNIPQEDIKVSADPKDNVCLKAVGQKPSFDFPFKNHLELNEKLNLFDFKRGAKISGSGWPVYRGWGARLEWALLNFMIEIHLKNGFEQWIPPICVRKDTAFWSGQLPKFETQQFRIRDEDYDLFLIPTAEVSLNGLHAQETFQPEELPLKYIAYTPCFRREAGAAGKDERGLIRMHQFNKVEMFAFTAPQDSPKVFDEMLASAEEVLEGLELHYRNMLLVTGDMSFPSTKTIDIEVWLPGQDRYYEVSSISNCTDFQSRRSETRLRTADGKLDFVHTLNGSGLATSRLMVALLENNQQKDGSILIPKALQKYLGGKKSL